jgi:hypothetical protein
MVPIITVQIEREKNRTIQMFDTTLSPIYLIHDQIHQTLAGT